jgi:putative spermidine/putrescine transport system permease protein
MSVASNILDDGVVRAADGTPLKRKLRQTMRAEQIKALMLIAPLFLFIVFSFLIPIGTVLTNAFIDPAIHNTMPKTIASLKNWDGKELPGEEAFAAFAADMKAAQKSKQVALVGKRLNYEIPTLKSKVVVTARNLDKIETGPWKEAVIGIDPVWSDIETWVTLKRASAAYTPFYLLNVLDLKQGIDGNLQSVEADRAVYKQILYRTLGISFLVTLLTLILGYPVAFLLATLKQKHASILMIFVLLPFWTSLLVRTTAWTILLQDGGVVTQFMHFSGITWLLNVLGFLQGEPTLFKTRFATVLAHSCASTCRSRFRVLRPAVCSRLFCLWVITSHRPWLVVLRII